MTYLLWLLAPLAAATPHTTLSPEPRPWSGGAWIETLPADVAADLDPDAVDRLLEDAAGRAPVGATSVELRIVEPDGTERSVHELLPVPAPVPIKEPHAEGRRAAPVDAPGASTGFLSDKAVYMSQCHGWYWSDVLGRYAAQRGAVWDTVEDFHNPEGADQYLLRYLENAGARTFTTRERDLRPELAIADNDGGGYSESGSGFADGLAGFADVSPFPYGVDPFDAGTTRTFPADGGGVATWVPDISEDGAYAVYVSWDSDPDNATDAHYRITHPGGVIDRWFDQTVHGSTWQYVETLWLPAGTPLTVELIGDSSQSGRTLSADAVRVGGGLDDVSRHGALTGRPRWESAAIHYIQYNGAPTSVYDPAGDGTTEDGGSDPSSRSRWAEWEHPSGEDAVYLSWHSNATEYGTARGTVTYYAGTACGGSAVDGSYDLAALVQAEIVDTIEHGWEPGWTDRGVATACFSEVSPYNNGEMPSILVELAFHDNEQDATLLKHPRFRDDASRAMYRGIVRYFAERDGVTPVYLPEPPVAVQVVHEGGELVARWSDGPVGAPYGDAPTGYRVYTSADGRSWDNGTEVTGTSTPIAADPGQTVFVRVSATNDGGESFPSSVVGARRSSDGQAPVLIVDAFDRLDRGTLLRQTPHSSLGEVVHMDLAHMNPYDTAAVHGRSVAAAGYAFDAIADEALSQVDLSDYLVVVWAAGEESTVEETVATDQQQALRAFVDGGGGLWMSGAEILWDLDTQGSPDDQAFAAEVLGATLASDDAGTDRVDGEDLLAGLALDFGLQVGGTYPVEYPDVLDTAGTVLARYDSGEVAGALSGSVALFGFPFETIADPAARDAVATALLPALAPDYVPPDPPTTTTTGGGTTPTGGGTTPDGGLDPRTVEGRERGGCGCDASGGGGWAWGVLLLALASRRRA